MRTWHVFVNDLDGGDRNISQGTSRTLRLSLSLSSLSISLPLAVNRELDPGFKVYWLGRLKLKVCWARTLKLHKRGAEPDIDGHKCIAEEPGRVLP